MPEIKLPAGEVFSVLKENILVDGFHVVIDLERSHGAVIVDALDEKEYLDCYGYFATLPVGHNHPKMEDEGFRRSLMTAARLTCGQPGKGWYRPLRCSPPDVRRAAALVIDCRTMVLRPVDARPAIFAPPNQHGW